jgi:hypothetical protein
VTCFTIISNTFADQIAKYIGYVEICAGVGYGIGPSLGHGLYEGANLGYANTMYTFAGINCVTFILCVFMLPNSLN